MCRGWNVPVSAGVHRDLPQVLQAIVSCLRRVMRSQPESSADPQA